LGVTLWIAWTMRYALRNRITPELVSAEASAPLTGRDLLTGIFTIGPILTYVVRALAWGWGFDQLSAAATLGMIAVGVVNRMGATRTAEEVLHGMQALLPAAIMVGLARSIAVVLADGKVIDTILHALATPLGEMSTTAAALLMVPVQALIHIPVTSVSGQ